MTGADPDLALAFAAGLLSFLSPCVLPLIPSFLSYIGGVSLSELRGTGMPRGRIVARTALFIAGFTAVFTVLGIVFSGSGLFMADAIRTVSVAAGAIVAILGLNMIFDFVKVLNFEKRVHLTRLPSGYFGAFLIGMAFGGGWTPCVGPILAGILFLAGQSGRIGDGAALLTAYSLGLGLPFLAASIFFDAFTRRLAKIRKHLGAIRIASGVFLVGIGLLIATGRFQTLNMLLPSWGYSLEAWSVANPAVSRVVLAAAMILIGLAPFMPAAVRAVRRERSAAADGDTRGTGTPESEPRDVNASAPGTADPIRSGDVKLAESASAATHSPVFTVPKTVFLALSAAIGVLELAGGIDLAGILAYWLTFQGI